MATVDQIPHPALRARECNDCTGYDVAPERLLEAMTTLHKLYPMLMDITAVDHGTAAKKRFEVLYHLYNPHTHQACRVASFCFSNISPTIPSVAALWKAADWHERESFDLMGILFEGHPDLRRILMWDEYPYHPLRKDFPLAGIPTLLPGEDVATATQAEVDAAPMAGGPFVSGCRGPMSQKEPSAKDEAWREQGPQNILKKED